MNTTLERTAYKAGYLEGAMKTLLLRLEYDSRESMAAFVRESIDRAALQAEWEQ